MVDFFIQLGKASIVLFFVLIGYFVFKWIFTVYGKWYKKRTDSLTERTIREEGLDKK
jgi:hypothetical protein